MESFEGPASEAPARDTRLLVAAWKAVRKQHAEAQRRVWLTNITLGPLSFAGLALLAGSPCPQPMDFVALGGSSAGVLLLWFYLGERCQTARARAALELRAAESAAGRPGTTADGALPDRMVRVGLAVLLAILWSWAWAVRPDCTVPDDEEGELTAYAAPAPRLR